MEQIADANGWDDGRIAFGYTKVDTTNRFAYIYLREHISDEITKTQYMGKHCMEYILIHELCHVVLPYPSYDRDTLECSLMWEMQHQKVEQFACALFAAKYGNLKFRDCWNK